MSTLLISVHPRHSQNILCEKKTVELRKLEPRDVKKALLYETSPTKTIVAELKIGQIYRLTVTELIVIRHELCLEKEEIEKYLPSGVGWCININKVRKLENPIPLTKMRELRILPPQSYVYLSDDQVMQLKSLIP